MSEWLTQPLGSLAAIQKGRKVETAEHPREGFAPYLGAAAISGIVEEYGDTRAGVMSAPGDVLMLWDGERSGLVGKAQIGIISSTVARLLPKAEVEGDYLYYALDFKFEWIQGHRTGTGVPHVPKDLSRILSISYPKNKYEQHRIAEILSTLDEVIAQTEKLIAKHQQIKAGLMHDLFTRGVTADGRLRPPREQAPELYRETTIGWIPKGWDVNSLRGLVGAGNIINGPFGSDLLTSELKTEGVPVLYVQDIKAGYFKRVSNAHVTGLKAAELAFCNVRRGDALVAKVGAPPCDSCVYPFEEKAIVTQDVIRIRPTPDVDPVYLSSLLNSPFGRKAIKRIAIEGTRERVSLTEFKSLVFPIADAHEQVRISERLTISQTLIEKEISNKEKLHRQKHGLMSDLLTGEVRVKVDTAVEEAMDG